MNLVKTSKITISDVCKNNMLNYSYNLTKNFQENNNIFIPISSYAQSQIFLDKQKNYIKISRVNEKINTTIIYSILNFIVTSLMLRFPIVTFGKLLATPNTQKVFKRTITELQHIDKTKTNNEAFKEAQSLEENTHNNIKHAVAFHTDEITGKTVLLGNRTHAKKLPEHLKNDYELRELNPATKQNFLEVKEHLRRVISKEIAECFTTGENYTKYESRFGHVNERKKLGQTIIKHNLKEENDKQISQEKYEIKTKRKEEYRLHNLEQKKQQRNYWKTQAKKLSQKRNSRDSLEKTTCIIHNKKIIYRLQKYYAIRHKRLNYPENTPREPTEFQKKLTNLFRSAGRYTKSYRAVWEPQEVFIEKQAKKDAKIAEKKKQTQIQRENRLKNIEKKRLEGNYRDTSKEDEEEKSARMRRDSQRISEKQKNKALLKKQKEAEKSVAQEQQLDLKKQTDVKKETKFEDPQKIQARHRGFFSRYVETNKFTNPALDVKTERALNHKDQLCRRKTRIANKPVIFKRKPKLPPDDKDKKKPNPDEKKLPPSDDDKTL